MADWYVSSVAYAAIAVFQVNHLYSIGDIVRQRGANATANLSALTESGTVVTATLNAHGFVVGQSVLIAGCTPSGYNGQVQITGVTANTFTYTASAGLTSPATVVGNVTDYVAVNNERAFRCTTGGTSNATTEPTWTLTKASTTTSGTATFTEATGNSSWAWNAASARLQLMLNGASSFASSSGDRVFVSSDHSETLTTVSPIYATPSNAWIRAISVNRAGSTPPVAGDITTGASITINGAALASVTLGGNNTANQLYIEGFTFAANGGSNQQIIVTLQGSSGFLYLKNCALQLTGSSAISKYQVVGTGGVITWDNTTVQFGAAGQFIQAQNSSFATWIWKNTPSAIQGATMPTSLCIGIAGEVQWRGLDLSATTGNLLDVTGGSVNIDFDMSDCKVNASASLTTGTVSTTTSYYDFVNVDSGATGYKNYWYRFMGTISTEATIVRSGGATDGVQSVSHKYVSTSTAGRTSFPLIGPELYAWQSATGSPVTATIEICSGMGAALNNDDIWLEVEYLGSSGAPVSSFVNDTIATILTANAAQTTSSHTFGDWGADCFNPASLTGITLSAANRTATKNTASAGGAPSVAYFSSGLICWEKTIGSVPANANYTLGFCNASFSFLTVLGSTANGLGYSPSSGAVKINGSTLSTIQTAGNGDVVGFAVDLTHNKVWIRKNGGNWNNDVIGNQNPATNTGGISLSTLSAGPYTVAFSDSSNSSVATLNGGSSAFNAAAPTGFTALSALNTQCLQVTLTPRIAGLVRGEVRLAKASTTVWVDPLMQGIS